MTLEEPGLFWKEHDGDMEAAAAAMNSAVGIAENMTAGILIKE